MSRSKRRHFDVRGAAMRTMTIAEAEEVAEVAPVKCDGDDWLMSHTELDRFPESPPDEECIGYDDEGQPIYAPVSELYPEMA